MAVFVGGAARLGRVNYVEYIQSTGTQYIVTDIVPTPTTKMVLDCELTYTAGAYTKTAGAYGNNASFSWWTYGANLEAYYAGASKSMTGPTGRVTLIADGNVWSAGGTDLTFTAASFTTNRPIWIGNIRDGGNYAPTPMKIYSCQIYENDVLVRDMWPCYDPAGVACLYDKVTKTYFYNAGTGEFIAGEAA